LFVIPTGSSCLFETSCVGYPVTHLHVAGDLNAVGYECREFNKKLQNVEFLY